MCTYVQIPDLRFYTLKICVHVHTETLTFRLHLWQAEFDRDWEQEGDSESSIDSI